MKTVRPIIPVLASVAGKEIPVYAMIDSAATSSAILLETADLIGAEIFQLPCKLSTFDSTIETERDFTNFTIKPLDRSFELDIQNALVGQILTTERDRPPRNSDIAHLDYMSDVHFMELDDPTIGIILDASYAWTWIGGEIRHGSREDLISVLTKFGWSLIGPSSDQAADTTHEADVCVLDSEEKSLQEQIALMFRHDFIMSGHEVAPPEQLHPSQKDEYALKQMKDSIRLDENLGHYRVALPWREGRAAAAKVFAEIDSYANAKSRLMKEKRKFLLDPARKEGTFKQIQDTMSQGHARIVDPERNVEGLPVWYLPIHVVTHPDKPGKYRVCQDGSAKVGMTHLNGHLCTGPDLLNGLVGILLRFRRHEVAVSSDIRGFFHMIHVEEEDIAAFRFLFFKDESMTDIIELESTVHIFGAGSSPPVANFTLKHHAEQMREKYGNEVADLIKASFYVDDCLSSFPDVDKAREMRQKLTAALLEGGFELTKWASSHPEVLIDDPISLPPHSQANLNQERSAEKEEKDDEIPLEVTNQDGDQSLSLSEEIESTLREENVVESTKQFTQPTAHPQIGKVLGVGYGHGDDSIYIRVTDRAKVEVKTKRGMLRLVHSVFDPTGIAAPLVVTGRLFFQRANELVSSWDEQLPDEILIPFNKWRETLCELENIKIPRWTSAPAYRDSMSDLCVFSDSSKDAYGIVIYVRRHLKDNDKAHVAQLFAKALVVPTSMHKYKLENQEEHNDSIPRLELNAARLAAVTRDLICREAGEKFDRVFMFTDSYTVLNWINDFDRKFKTFENFRIKRIRLLTDVSEWRHVPSKENPADICSHGLNADDTHKWRFFHSGPQWLAGPESSWPPARPKPTTEPDAASVSAIATFSPLQLIAINATVQMPSLEAEDSKIVGWRLSLASKRDTWKRKVRFIARAEKTFRAFIDFMRAKKEKRDLRKLSFDISVTAKDYDAAEINLINEIQLKHFEKEHRTLLKLGVTSPNSHRELRSKTSLTNLNPFLDDNLTLRVGSRIASAESVSYNAKFPIILPKNDEHVNALVRHEHEVTMHSTINHCFHMLRSRFHIMGGRATVNKILRRCIPCQKKEKPSQPQKEGELPPERVNFTKPFRCTAIDACGPWAVRQGGRQTHKRWVLVASCMSTRAVSLLPLKDMTTSTLINALIKLHNQFPGIELIYSDNGTNFQGASREIKDAVNAWNADQINESLMSKGIEWKWSPPNSPHFGGIWERIVRSAKRHLKFILEQDNLNIDVFETALSQVAAILNSRPLTYASSDINEMRVLSPSDFLYPYTITPSSTTILPPIPAGGDHLRGTWREVRRLATIFQERWKEEYLKTLLPRTKWLKSNPNLYVGQLVLLMDEQEPRKDWRIARVDEILSADKNHVRRVRVTTADRKSFERHVTKLVALELDQEDEKAPSERDDREKIVTRSQSKKNRKP